MSTVIVPLGPLAILFAIISIAVFIRKAIISRKIDENIKKRITKNKQDKYETLSEQKRRLELLLKK